MVALAVVVLCLVAYIACERWIYSNRFAALDAHLEAHDHNLTLRGQTIQLLTERVTELESMSAFRSKLATIERERAERQRTDLEADMARAVDPFAIVRPSAEGKE